MWLLTTKLLAPARPFSKNIRPGGVERDRVTTFFSSELQGAVWSFPVYSVSWNVIACVEVSIDTQ